MDFDFSFLAEYSGVLWRGLLTTLQFVGIAVVLGLVWGFVLSLGRTSSNKGLYWLATLYVEFFRGTPVLVQLFWIFFCLPLFLGVELSGFISAVIALSLYSGAITSESFRAALKSIDASQFDACIALGLPQGVQTVFVILPQAMLRAIPNLLSNVVSLFKESALVSAVGMADLMYVGQNIANNVARPIEILTAIALIYFAIGFPLTRAVSLVEGRLLKVVKA
ncbi:amino acid ABC transporter permease [Leisingera sp. ANG-M1]|uniref:amino acid ABC transporter permease n=1 Tax=Leisingera sp. ANG-M1 TaxID=1577895 RepID=UPI0005802098|nr:amino acid ABC transporter permease [Leisingera sp. ANG-M1]KIC09718.1 amino acid ABC transporter permease [Leisingera sp. ANG-M1]